ncbi:ABC transporter permease [Bradyrhizobium sp. WSM1417]|uniref:ABC transporter permease n=1 Tax=Bradyrhizobium sp. WSM1417 TaxID=754500 RepID=UPI000487E6B2|nr:ABC transporter permease [Bradyrhizobium sp. WSM1417]
MVGFLIRRVLQTIPVLFIVTGLIFGMLWMIPGDPARAFVGPGEVLDEQQLDVIRKEHSFDRPVVVQYALWLGKIVKGDLGRSVQTNRRVAGELAERAQVTLGLGLMGVLLAVVLSLPAGIASAIYRGRFADYLATILSVGAVAIPGFWLGIVMILLFGVELRWLPVQGYVPFSDSLRGWLAHIVLPAIALAVTSCALLMRQTRSAMLEVLAQDYVRTARAKGMPNSIVIWVHSLRNALLPVVTLLGLQVGQIFAGAVVIETLFGIPGLGSFLVQAIFQRDFAVVQAAVLLIALGVLTANLITDVVCAWLDPRIRYGI